MVHGQYLNAGQNARNRLFGIDPHTRTIGLRRTLQMMISQPGKNTTSRLAVIVFGLVTLITGIVLSTIPWVDYVILSHLKLWNGSITFQYWQKPGVMRLTKIYIFNMTNPEGFLNLGEKPKLSEVGPFVYREDMEKVNVQFHDNGTVSFQHKKNLHFVPELSRDKNLKLIVPNLPLLALSTHSNSFGYFIQRAVSIVLSFGDHKPFIPLTPEQLIFGYDDAMIALAHHLYPEHKKPTEKLGVLLNRNGTLKDVYTIYSGTTGLEQFGIFDNINGMKKLPYWPEPCNSIAASEGSFFPPKRYTKGKHDKYYIYDKDICRLMSIQYRHSETKNGIPVDIYTPADDMYLSVDKVPENKCYCPGNEYCPPDGMQSIMPCHHDAPLYASFPHFYKGDPSLLEGIEGLSPNPDKHASYLKINPKLGVPLEGQFRLQVNMKIDRAPNVAAVSGFPSIIWPILWVEDGITDLTPALNRFVYLATTFADIANPLATYGSILLGSCILIGVFINAYKSLVFTRDTLEMSMRTLRRGNNLLHSNNNRLLIIRDSYTLLPELPSPGEECV